MYGVGGGSLVEGELAINIAAPLAISVDSTGFFSPNPFSVNVLVSNTTIDSIAGITATITLSAGLRLADGESATRSIDPAGLGAGRTGSVSWSVIAETRSALDSLSYTVSVSAAGGYTNSASRRVTVPAGTSAMDEINGLYLSITAVNAEEFPLIRAYCLVTDPVTRRSVNGLNESNFVVHEDGVHENPITVTVMSEGGIGDAADIAVVFDVTGSMGSYITGMKNHCVAFAESLGAAGINSRRGLVTFLDEDEEVHNFTNEATEDKGWITGLYAHGGGDTPENALEGINRSFDLSWREGVQRIVIMITDAPYHQNNTYTTLNNAEVIRRMNDRGMIGVVVGYNDDYQKELASSTGGFWFPIGSDFSDILDGISGILSSQYIITYTTHNPIPDNRWRIVRVDVNFDEFADADTGRYWVGTSSLFFDPETTYTANGLSFSVDVFASSLTDLMSARFKCLYDGTKVQYDSVKTE
jgi:hypothetical protein